MAGMRHIDLAELMARESERVEWKEDVADVEQVARTICAFSNDYANLGGGYVVCGAREERDEHGFQKAARPGLTAGRLREIEGKVLALCRDRVSPSVAPQVEELEADAPGRRVLVFIAPATRHAHHFRDHAGHQAHWVRIGRETREARNGIYRELLVRKGDLEPWDERMNPRAGEADIDLLALRAFLVDAGLWDPSAGVERYLSDVERVSSFTPPLLAREPLTDRLRPRNFALLLFGKDPLRLIPGAYASLSVYPGPDRSEARSERTRYAGTVVQQARGLIARLRAEVTTLMDKADSHPNQAKYPERALNEALVNAFAHRDYESREPVRVAVHPDRVEILSPGGLPAAVDPGRFREGMASPYWRNQALCYFLNTLQLAQGEGQGIPTILRTMEQLGNPRPVFDLGAHAVKAVLPAHPRHEDIRAALWQQA